ncbi:pentapeptide repeat-containing protein [Rhizobium rhizosphaerae]|uniref:pentapeptide repeat-containing protein n=1 Tax=Xaviernesmea rhizosphaerae TaxID=1672749 RepID=UPI00117BAA78
MDAQPARERHRRLRARLNEANLTNTSLNQINFSSKLYNHCNMIGWFGTDVNLACSGFQDIKLSDVVFSAMPLCQRDALRRPPWKIWSRPSMPRSRCARRPPGLRKPDVRSANELKPRRLGS